jgi:hypothetical protein
LSSFLRPAHGKPLLVLPLWTTLLWLAAVVVEVSVAAAAVQEDSVLEQH